MAHPVRMDTTPGFSLGHFGTAMIACLMAYNGWTYVSFIAGEVKEPNRNLPRALALGMAAVIALYLLANVAYLKVMAIPQIAATERVGAALAQLTLGSAGATLVSVTILLSIIGAINGCIMTAARIPFAQAGWIVLSPIFQDPSSFSYPFVCNCHAGNLGRDPGTERIV